MAEALAKIVNGNFIDYLQDAIIENGGIFISEDWFLAADNNEFVIGNNDDGTEYVFPTTGDRVEIA